MPVQQGFNIEEGSPELGRWSVRFKPDAPGLWRRTALRADTGLFFNTVCVTPERIRDPGLTRSTLLSKAVFSGLIESASGGAMTDPWEIAGPSIVAWLGNGDNPQAGPTGTSSGGSVTLATFLTAVFSNGFTGKHTNGLTLTSAATCSTNTITDGASGEETARQIIDRWCRQTSSPTEWWCSPNGGCEFAVQGNSAVFTQTPQVLLGRGVETGISAGVHCFPTTTKVDYSIRGWANEVVVYDGSSTSAYNTGPSFGTFDPSNQMLSGGGYMYADTQTGGNGFGVYYRVSDTGELTSLATVRHKNSGNYEERRHRTAEVDAHCLASHLKPGDWCYLYDPDTYATNTSNEVTVSGKLLYPMKARVVSMDWPIKPGMGVYMVTNGTGDILDGAGSGTDYSTVIDLTDHIIPETQYTRVDLNVLSESVRRQTFGFERKNAGTASWR